MAETLKNLYSLEGIDGAGKSTQSYLVPAALETHGIETKVLKSPDNTLLGNFIRANVRILPPWLRNKLFLLDFEASMRNVQARTEKTVYIWDRYVDSFYASNPEMSFHEAQSLSQGLPLPRRTFLLDMEPQYVFSERTTTLDHHSDPEWLQMKAQRYRELAELFSERIVKIDARQPKEAITEQIVQEIVSQTETHWSEIEATKIPATTEIDTRIWGNLIVGDTVLEVGAGNGRIIDLCRQRGLNVTGIDINAKAIEQLGPRYSDQPVTLYHQSITDTSLPDNSFQGAFMQGVASTLTKEDRAIAFRQLYRVLAPNAKLHVAEFLVDESTNEKITRYLKDGLVADEYGTLISRGETGKELFRSHNFRPEELAGLITGAGFEIVSILEKPFFSYHGHLKPGIIFIAQKSA